MDKTPANPLNFYNLNAYENSKNKDLIESLNENHTNNDQIEMPHEIPINVE